MRRHSRKHAVSSDEAPRWVRRARITGFAFACASAFAFAIAFALPAASEDGVPRTPSKPGAKAYIISPADGAEVSSPVTVRFGLSSMGVAPAGTVKAGTGHHHLIIDAPIPPAGAPIPADEKHKHFGGGQTEVVLELSPGKHTLQLMLGDHSHVPHDPPVVSEIVTITVVD